MVKNLCESCSIRGMLVQQAAFQKRQGYGPEVAVFFPCNRCKQGGLRLDAFTDAVIHGDAPFAVPHMAHTWPTSWHPIRLTRAMWTELQFIISHDAHCLLQAHAAGPGQVQRRRRVGC